MNVSQRDKNIIWHPFTQEKMAADPIHIKRASGAYLYDENDHCYLDLISSWWVNLHGHAHPEIAQAIYEQAKILEHVVFAGFTHQPAVDLCENLRSLLPSDLCKFFFSDNGSTSVEVALKMAYQYWINSGITERHLFLSFDGGYHGDTFGAMSVGMNSGFHHRFKDLFFKVLFIPYPETWDDDKEVCLKEEKALAVLRNYLEQYGNNIAALILEPLIQGAGGMRLCRPEFIENVLNLVRQHDILVIFDEVMTGFYRTGTYFAFNQIHIIPDFLCLSKGLTGGFLPLALTITTNKIHEAFLGDDFQKTFLHGHSYTANPLSCSAAVSSLNLLKSSSCRDSVKNIQTAHRDGMDFLFSECRFTEKPRKIGTIAAFDLKNVLNRMPFLKKRFLEEGLILRPLGNTIYLLPPYCITTEEIKSVYSRLVQIINDL